MSGLGILAAGVAGGANAVSGITGGMIDQERRLRVAERLRQMGREDAIDAATGAVGKARLEAAGQAGRQGNAIAQEGARWMIPVDVEKADALRPGKIADAEAAAKAKHDQEKSFAIADANDPAYIGAVTKIKLADPEVAQRIAASRAQVAASGASVGLIQAQTEGVILGNADKKQLDKLYADAGTILSDSSIDDTERAKRYMKVQQQIVLMKSKNGQVSGDKDIGVEERTKEITSADGLTKDITKVKVRAGGGGGGGAGDKPPPPQAAIDALKADPSLASQFAEKYGQSAASAVGAAAGAANKPEPPPKKQAGILPAATAATSADPLAGLSRNQIRDKRADLLTERTRWAGTSGAAPRLAEIDELIARIDSGQY